MITGKKVTLFMPDGTPGGLLAAEVGNWTGHLVAAPRSDIPALQKRAEFRRTGVYILLGDDPDALGSDVVYVGEADDISKRLYRHALSETEGGKDFWNRVILITSKDHNLTKAHARYLESRLLALAAQANRAQVRNGTVPQPIALPEADVSDMEYFLSQAQLVLPLLGVNAFRPTAVPPVEPRAPEGPQLSPIFELLLPGEGGRAFAQEIDGEFTVRAGSLARRTWGRVRGGYELLRRKLERDGTLAMDETSAQFTRDHVFSSPSAAAAVVLGRAANGRAEWKVAGSTTTYAYWQLEQLQSPEVE